MILKVQYKDELRRVALEHPVTLATLTERVRSMFPQLPQRITFRCADFLIVSEDDLQTAIEQAQTGVPPLLRLVVSEVEQPPIPKPSMDLFSLAESLPLVASCEACRRPLGRVYFKCLNCLHAELCVDCEALESHNAQHLLVKLRVPVDQLPLKQQLVFKSHILDPSERVLARQAKKQLRANKAGLAAQKKEERRRERAQKKLRRLEQKLESRKKKSEVKKHRHHKVKKVKKVLPQQALPVEPVVAQATVAELAAAPTSSGFYEIPPVRPTILGTSSAPVSPMITEPKEEFNIFRMMAEFQLLKEDKKKHEQPALPEQPQIELVKEEAREEIEPAVVEETAAEIESQPTIENIDEEVVEPAELRSSGTESPFQRNLQMLEDMGFTDRNHNIELLVRNVGNLETTVEQLLREASPGIFKWLPFNLPL